MRSYFSQPTNPFASRLSMKTPPPLPSSTDAVMMRMLLLLYYTTVKSKLTITTGGLLEYSTTVVKVADADYLVRFDKA